MTLGQLAAIRAIVTIHGGVNRAALVAAIDVELEHARVQEQTREENDDGLVQGR